MSFSSHSQDSRENRERERDRQTPRNGGRTPERKPSYHEKQRYRTSYQNKSRSNSNPRAHKQRVDQRPRDYKDQRNDKPTYPNQFKQQRSDFNKHFLYYDLFIKRENEKSFMNKLQEQLSRFGPVDNLRITKRDGDRINVCVAFQFDSDAINFIEDAKSLEIYSQNQKVSLHPKLSRAFDYYFKQAKRIKIQLDEYKRKEERRIELERKRRERSPSSNQRHSKQRSRNQKYRRSPSERKQSDKIQMTSLRIFGTPLEHSKYDVGKFIANHKNKKYYVQSVQQKSFESARYFEVRMNERDAHEFLSEFEESKFYQLLPVVFECSDSRNIKQHLKDFQVRLQFSSAVHPYNVYKCLSQYGNVVQLVLQNQDQKVYYVTMDHRGTIKELKNLRLQAKGISINSLKEGQLVYRPGIELRVMMQSDDNRS